MASIDWPIFLLAAIGITVAPGPDNLFVITVGMARGRKEALALAWGMALGNLGHTLAVTLGVAVVLTSTPLVFVTFKTLGATYLGWLAWQAWRTPIQTNPDSTIAQQSVARWFRRGVIMNLLNPKVALFFLAFLPPFVPSETDSPATATMILGGVFIAQVIVVFSIFALAAGTIGNRWRNHPQLLRWAPRLTAVFLAALAVFLLFAQIPTL